MTLPLTELERLPGVRLQRSYCAKNCTTMAVGGDLEFLIDINSCGAFEQVFALLNAAAINWRCIGAGSNIVVADRGLTGATLRLGRGFSAVTELGTGRFRVEAGAALPSISSNLARAGFAGLEFAAGIPGSIGGAVRMNAGAHGGQMSDLVEAIEVVTPQAETYQIPASQLGFAYRTCALPASVIITAAVLRLVPGERDAIMRRRGEMLAERKARQPLTSPSSGSVFRNPVGAKSAGALLEACGLKGLKVGGAEVSQMHANWIVNPHRCAIASDVVELRARMFAEVKQRFGVELESEVIYLQE